jgi:hypothetical protein
MVGYEDMAAADVTAPEAPEGKEASAEEAVGKALDMIPPEMIINYLKTKEILPPDFEMPTPGTDTTAAPMDMAAGDVSFAEMGGETPPTEGADEPVNITGHA